MQGDGGLFYQTWYPVCFSKDVAVGQVIGRAFLDGRIVVMRGEDGFEALIDINKMIMQGLAGPGTAQAA